MSLGLLRVWGGISRVRIVATALIKIQIYIQYSHYHIHVQILLKLALLHAWLHGAHSINIPCNEYGELPHIILASQTTIKHVTSSCSLPTVPLSTTGARQPQPEAGPTNHSLSEVPCGLSHSGTLCCHHCYQRYQ